MFGPLRLRALLPLAATLVAHLSSPAEAQPLVVQTDPLLVRARGAPGRCLELPHARGSRLALAGCHGQRSQQFVIGYRSPPDLVLLGLDTIQPLYMEPRERCVSTAAPLAAAPCEAAGGWTYTARGELRLRARDACLDARGPALRPCNGSARQRWDVVPADAPPRAGIVGRVRSEREDVPGAEIRVTPIADPYRWTAVRQQDREGGYPLLYGGAGSYRVELLSPPPGHALTPGDSAARTVRARPGERVEVTWRVRAAASGAAAMELARMAAAERAALSLRNVFLPSLAHDRLAPVAERNPDAPRLWSLLAATAMEAERWGDAVRAHRRLLASEPLNGSVMEEMARAYDSLAANTRDAASRRAVIDSAAAVRARLARLPVNLCGVVLAPDGEARASLHVCPGGTLAPGATQRIEITFFSLGTPVGTAMVEVAAPGSNQASAHHHAPAPSVALPPDPAREPVTGHRYRVLP